MNEALYAISHSVVASAAQIFFRGEIHGIENVPLSGSFLLAANHASHLDPPLLGCQLPLQFNFFARKTLWKGGIASWWLDNVGTIPVDRDGGSDVTALKRTIATLQNGGRVILFPEGTRSPDGELQPPKSGVGMIACKSGVPVLPARIFGTAEAFGRGMKFPKPHRVSCVIGTPLLPAAYDDPAAGKQRYQIASERIMAAIGAIKLPRETVV